MKYNELMENYEAVKKEKDRYARRIRDYEEFISENQSESYRELHEQN